MKKLLSCTAFLLCLVILKGLFPVILAEGTNDPVHILACSDFQAPNGNDEGRLQVNAILSAMKKDGITKADGLFACGDYDYDFTDTEGGIKMLSQTLNSFVKTNKIFVQGNHDSANAAVGTKGLAESGNNDPAHGKYGAFVINEEDYMWYNDDETTVMRTAQKLIEYLNEKLTSGFDKPIFVLSHLGLHYTMRTAKEGDGKYAHYLFDVLNEAGKKGLNIVFLYGHNHSNGWDDYLGGPAVFLHKGDKMYVGQGSNTAKRSETLHFTYLNAGYTGYYSNVNGQDDALTMTYITVDGGEVSFVRYDKNGVHNMKSAGVTNAYQGESGYKPNTTVYTSPQSITLTALSDWTPIENLLTIDKTLPVWKKILSADELKDGCRYLLVRNGSQDSIMLPTVVTKAYTDGSERIGFDLYDTEDFGDKLAFATVDDAEWLFTKAQGGWLIGDGYSYLTRQQTENQGIAAIFTEEGHVLQIKGENGSFNIYNGSFYSFNYNKRHLINFYTSDPAFFYLYEAVGYLVTVEDGTSSLPYAKAGESLTLTASDAPEGYLFDSWTVTNGLLTLDDPTKETVTFTMPDGAVTLKANYKPLPVTNAPITTDTPVTDAPQDDTPDRNSTVLIVSIVIGAIALVGITAAVTVIVMKKKAK
ncbi:MAG: hypothetical protein IKC63_07210 [Clostridia bacterium]|nr:hypothetical protein [Clostridia bacterium]